MILLDTLYQLRSYARQIKNRSGYTLRPSEANPRVRRWQRNTLTAGATGQAALSPEAAVQAFGQYMRDPARYRQTPPMLADALIAGRWRLPHSEVARLSRLQAGAWRLHGGAKDLVALIEAGATAAGQFGPDHQRLMEYLASADRPLLVDTFEVAEDNYERWAEALERGVVAMGGQVLGAVPRTSAFEWQWEWGPPPQNRVRVQTGDRMVVVSPEATVLIRPPEGRERWFAQRYFERIRKAQPLAAAKQAVQERLAEAWPRVLRYVMAGREGAGPDWEEVQAAIEELKRLELREAAAHARRYRRGEVLTPVAWYEVDTRANYRPDDAWAWGRLTATPEGVHYISHQVDKGGPRLVVSPDIAPWIQYSTIAPGDKYGQQ